MTFLAGMVGMNGIAPAWIVSSGVSSNRKVPSSELPSLLLIALTI